MKTIIKFLRRLTLCAVALITIGGDSQIYASDTMRSEDTIGTEVPFGAQDSKATEDPIGKSNWKLQTGPLAAFQIFMPANWTSSHIYPGEKAGYGGALGWAIRFNYADRWYLQSGLNFEFDNAPIQMRSTSPSDTWPSYRYTRGGIAIPCLGGYRFALTDELGMSVFTGVTGTWTFADRLKSTHGGETYTMLGSDGAWRAVNLQWTAGLSFELDNRFTVSIGANLGVIQMARRDIFRTAKMYETNVQVSAFYWLPLHK